MQCTNNLAERDMRFQVWPTFYVGWCGHGQNSRRMEGLCIQLKKNQMGLRMGNLLDTNYEFLHVSSPLVSDPGEQHPEGGKMKQHLKFGA